MKARIEQEIASLPDNFIVGLVVKSASYEEANMHVLNILMQKYGHLGSYVTINKPYAHITEQLKGKNIQTDNLYPEFFVLRFQDIQKLKHPKEGRDIQLFQDFAALEFEAKRIECRALLLVLSLLKL